MLHLSYISSHIIVRNRGVEPGYDAACASRGNIEEWGPCCGAAMGISNYMFAASAAASLSAASSNATVSHCSLALPSSTAHHWWRSKAHESNASIPSSAGKANILAALQFTNEV